jgi:hypothetical protein
VSDYLFSPDPHAEALFLGQLCNFKFARTMRRAIGRQSWDRAARRNLVRDFRLPADITAEQIDALIEHIEVVLGTWTLDALITRYHLATMAVERSRGEWWNEVES